ncbi:MAG TPA: TIGR04222 domain-containing membrane protein [Pirellulales bacterium]|jgi:uncharacterized protein (TIGR04222 family)|nr:TIGR04222 domain-containing membrane protein [Pirellulales bacterium]
MDREQVALWQAIDAHQIDDPAAALPFTKRLARENGWSAEYARRAVQEYKRFCFLAVTMPENACPSQEVDQAWHLHLTYTRDYWGRFCPEVLGRPLHHEPTRGGPGEHAKHVAMYERTLAAYREAFGHEPPADIWPDTDTRLGRTSRSRHVPLARHWIIPKPRMRRWLGEHAFAPALALGGAGLLWGALVSPFDLTGPQFLILYAMLYAAAIAWTVLYRRRLRNATSNDSSGVELSPYEAACLAYGEQMAWQAAVAQLTSDGVLKLRPVRRGVGAMASANESQFYRGEPPRTALEPIEQAVLELIPATEEIPAKTLCRAPKGAAAKIVDSLRSRGLLLDEGAFRRARFWPAAALAALLLFGFVKLIVGIVRDRPIGFLVIALFVTFGTLVVLLAIAQQRTARGTALLEAYRDRMKSARDLFKTAGEQPGRTDMTWVIALFGMTALAAPMYADLRYAVTSGTPNTSGAGGCGSGGCGSGGCGGGGCGGGGCGGGGCGGGGCGGGGCGGCS